LPRASYPLTAAAIVASVGAGVFCLDLGSVGKTYRLHASRPDASLNARVQRARAEAPAGSSIIGAGGVVESASPLILVRIDGPLEQRAGYYPQRGDICGGGWTDGHDAVAERLIAALAEGDVLLVGDGPGGAAAGIEQNVSRVVAAKAKYGRRVTGYIDEQIASAHAWWFLAVCDEVFIPPMGTIGSVGARGEHMDISGMMAREGLVKTYFAYPADKVALAPEFPLSKVGADRGNRDVRIAGDTFVAAICAGPVGQRYGLTPEGVLALGADMLTGEAAVGIFADGVETLEDVTAYALALAESGERIETTTGAARASTKGAAMRLEGDEKPDKGDGEKGPDSDNMRGTDIPTKCGACGVENNKVAKFCMGCGESMATKAAEEPMPEKKEAKAQPVAKPSAAIARASLATETAAVEARWVFDAARAATGRTSAAEIVGALSTMPERLAAADLAVEMARIDRVAAETTQRRALAGRLNRLGLDAWPPTMIYSGPATDGKRALSPVIATMDLGVLAGIVETYEKRAPAALPFDASRDKAKDDAAARANAEGITPPGTGPLLGANGEPSDAQIVAAMADPVVKQIAATSGRDLRKVATQHLKTRASLAGGTVAA